MQLPRNFRSHFRNSAIILLIAAVTSLAHDGPADPAAATAYTNKPSDNTKPDPHQGSAYSLKGTIPGEPLDEAKSGRTLRGTPVTPRTDECFPAEPRDLFWQMDWVAKEGHLVPLDFDEDASSAKDPATGIWMSGLTDSERDGIRGRNTWLLWGGGNETFWGWLQERGYGLTDYLILMDSRQRANRFKSAGLINQPGFESSGKTILGLYLDQPRGGDWRNAMLRPPPSPEEWKDGKLVRNPYPGDKYGPPEPELYDARGRKLAKPVEQPSPPPGHPTKLFEPWTTLEAWEKDHKSDDGFKDYIPELVREKLPQDGLDTSIYGYPSGIFGLRLMLNPDFFANTAAAAEARGYWKKRVETTNGRYYTDKSINEDPDLVRPFRVTMSCGFCHVAQHPLNPPLRDDEPEWENLSSIIGAQYWDPQAANANQKKPPEFLYHFLKSQAPGSIDTSLVSTDHINNTNVINPIFDVPARLARAMAKPPEKQSPANLSLPSIEDPETGENPNGPNNLRHFPMVLGPGEDSVGVFGALERVPHNVGVYPEMWLTTGNLLLGYTPQRPFSLEVGKANSVYWNVNVKYRVPYMAKFFDLGYQLKVPKSTAAMKLKDAWDLPRDPNRKPAFQVGQSIPGADGKPERLPVGQMILDHDIKDNPTLRDTGRKVFLDNCAICHSSKLPAGFDLRFTRDVPQGGWANAPAPADPKAAIYTLPMEYAKWDDFRKSPAMKHFRDEIAKVAGPAPSAGEEDGFITNNFLSNELRIPITLVGTYAGRALATNAMKGNVWDNYSSETFKELASVGNIRYFNPYKEDASKVKLDPFGTNADFNDGRTKGGPGYFRPATLISIWASAPFFHNNALGIYTHDTSVRGRMLAFDDAARKLLWDKQRSGYSRKEAASDPRLISIAPGNPGPGGDNTAASNSTVEPFTYIPPGDLRPEGSLAAANDPGYIYRLPVDARIQFQPGFIPLLIRNLLAGFVGEKFAGILFSIMSFWSWVVLTAFFAYLIFKGRSWHAGGIALLLGFGVAVATFLLELGGMFWLLAAIFVLTGIWLLQARDKWKGLTRGFFVAATLVTLFVGILANKFLTGHLKKVNLVAAVLPNSWFNADYQGIDLGPIPRGTPVNLLMNLDPDLKKIDKVGPALLGLTRALVQINRNHLTGEEAYKVFAAKAGPALMAASKCPDFVLDRGHWFGESLSDQEKEALIAFLKTL